MKIIIDLNPPIFEGVRPEVIVEQFMLHMKKQLDEETENSAWQGCYSTDQTKDNPDGDIDTLIQICDENSIMDGRVEAIKDKRTAIRSIPDKPTSKHTVSHKVVKMVNRNDEMYSVEEVLECDNYECSENNEGECAHRHCIKNDVCADTECKHNSGRKCTSSHSCV
jgi:hypothetical protein